MYKYELRDVAQAQKMTQSRFVILVNVKRV